MDRFRTRSVGFMLAAVVVASGCSAANDVIEGSDQPTDPVDQDADALSHKRSDAGTTSPGSSTGGGTTDGSASSDSGSTTPPPNVGYPAPTLSPPAAILKVGPGMTYATPCAAIAAAKTDDEIDIAPGTYTDSCTISVSGLRLKGVGGRPKIDLSSTDHPAGYKGIYVIAAPNVVIENLELTGAHISDANGANGAGLRVEADGLRVSHCYFHDNQNGILGAPATPAGNIWIEYSEFDNNALGNGCAIGGCTHNVYLGHFDTAIFQFNWSHHIATDTADKGHLLKSRASNTYVLYNRLTDETGHASYEVNMPNGGNAIIVGNAIQQGTTPGNPTLIAWGEEGASNPGKTVYLAYNTLVNDYSKGTFVNITNGGALTAHDNIFAGPGTVSNVGAVSADNLAGVDPLFVNRAAYDYHLTAGSPAIAKAVAPGGAGSFSLVPNAEYVHPTSALARTSTKDLGAFEHQ